MVAPGSSGLVQRAAIAAARRSVSSPPFGTEKGQRRRPARGVGNFSPREKKAVGRLRFGAAASMIAPHARHIA